MKKKLITALLALSLIFALGVGVMAAGTTAKLTIGGENYNVDAVVDGNGAYDIKLPAGSMSGSTLTLTVDSVDYIVDLTDLPSTSSANTAASEVTTKATSAGQTPLDVNLYCATAFNVSVGAIPSGGKVSFYDSDDKAVSLTSNSTKWIDADLEDTLSDYYIKVTPVSGYDVTVILNGAETISPDAAGKYKLGNAEKGELNTVEVSYSQPESDIKISSMTNGSVTANVTSAPKGTPVTLTVKPSTSYALDTISVAKTGGGTVSLTKKSDTSYTFTMPDVAVTVSATFTKGTYYIYDGTASKYGDINAYSSTSTSSSYKITRQTSGSTVYLRTDLNSGYEIKEMIVTRDDNGDEVTVKKSGSYWYFTMPVSDVTIEATFTSTGDYTVTVKTATRGAVTSSNTSADKGTTITLTVEPNTNYALGTLVVTDKSGNILELTKKNSTTYTFTMPSSNVTVTPTFVTDSAYAITTKTASRGFVSAPINAVKGADVVITAVPDTGYLLEDVTVVRTSGTKTEIEVTKKSNGTYTFEMPAYAVTITPTFEKGLVMNFTDIKSTDWYYSEVQWVYENAIMNGMSTTTFEPTTSITRGMIVTMLYRLEGEPSVSKYSIFPDVASNQYYTDAVYWAQTNSVVNGYDTGDFGPNDAITRQQLSAILYRYATLKGYSTSASNSITGFSDYGKIHDYAQTTMKWAYGKSLITGRTSTTLAPADNATRAEVAVSFARFCQNLAGMS